MCGLTLYLKRQDVFRILIWVVLYHLSPYLLLFMYTYYFAEKKSSYKKLLVVNIITFIIVALQTVPVREVAEVVRVKVFVAVLLF